MNLSGLHMVVLMGGPGSEREVSLRSGAAVAGALRRGGYRVTEVEVKDTELDLPADTGLCVNMIHGTFGEDGQLQGILDARKIPYTGEGEAGSRLAFDKKESKRRFEKAGVPTPRWEMIAAGERPSLPLPLVVKAPREGSSVGVHIIRHQEELDAALRDCASLDREILIEEFVEGRELTVGVVGDRAMAVVEIRPHEGFYDYAHKYTKGASDYFCPAPLDAETTRHVQDTALAAHRSLGLEVYSRVDILLAAGGIPFVLETNTIPGMTETSLLPKAAAEAGMTFLELCEEIAQLSLLRSSSHPSP
ncbi:MAG: D-alanine--D-alanine ligase [Chthoniobacterales bacterium]|nr:D-alanine--D-alanine ligase [Chthoniobacterales bacterium]